MERSSRTAGLYTLQGRLTTCTNWQGSRSRLTGEIHPALVSSDTTCSWAIRWASGGPTSRPKQAMREQAHGPRSIPARPASSGTAARPCPGTAPGP